MVKTSKEPKKMKIWMTVEPDPEEIDALLQKLEGVSKTPLGEMIIHGCLLMSNGHEVSLKITTMKRKGYE